MDEENQFLLTLRSPEKKEYPLCWENPGGGVQWGEESLTAALRELKEETGISASIILKKVMAAALGQNPER